MGTGTPYCEIKRSHSGEGTLGDTRLMGKLVFAEDYNQDGELEEVKYNDHWSWIYTLRNNPEDAAGDWG